MIMIIVHGRRNTNTDMKAKHTMNKTKNNQQNHANNPPPCLWARAASLSPWLSLGLGSGFWSRSDLGLDLGLSWWVEAFLLGPTHFSPLLAALLSGHSGLLFGLPVFL